MSRIVKSSHIQMSIHKHQGSPAEIKEAIGKTLELQTRTVQTVASPEP